MFEELEGTSFNYDNSFFRRSSPKILKSGSKFKEYYLFFLY